MRIMRTRRSLSEDEEEDEVEQQRQDEEQEEIALLQVLHTKETADAAAEVEASITLRNGVMTWRRKPSPPACFDRCRHREPCCQG